MQSKNWNDAVDSASEVEADNVIRIEWGTNVDVDVCIDETARVSQGVEILDRLVVEGDLTCGLDSVIGIKGYE